MATAAQRPHPLLVASAAVFFVAGASLLFLPQEILTFAAAPAVNFNVGVLQVLGSALFGFAMFNWMSRHTRIGGIYGRPLVMANLAHTASAALLLAKIAFRGPFSAPFAAVVAVYAALAIAFGWRLFAAPAAPAASQTIH